MSNIWTKKKSYLCYESYAPAIRYCRCYSWCSWRSLWDFFEIRCVKFVVTLLLLRHTEHWRGMAMSRVVWDGDQTKTVSELNINVGRVWFVRSVGLSLDDASVTRFHSPASACGSLCERVCSGRGPRCRGSQPAMWDRDPPRHKTWTSHSHG